MRILKVTPGNLPFFEPYLTREEKKRLETAKLHALGAVAGMTPCAIVLFTMEAREAYLEKLCVEEGFQRRGVATGLLEQIGKSFPGLYRMSCSYQENRCPAFDRLLRSRGDFFFEDPASPVYAVGKEEAAGLTLPGEDVEVREFFRMEDCVVRRFLGNRMHRREGEIDDLLTGHAWVEEACLCHGDGDGIDACLLTERTADGSMRLYHALWERDGVPAVLSCFRRILQMVRNGSYPAFEIVCRTDRLQRIFSRFLSEREPDDYLVTACRYLY